MVEILERNSARQDPDQEAELASEQAFQAYFERESIRDANRRFNRAAVQAGSRVVDLAALEGLVPDREDTDRPACERGLERRPVTEEFHVG